MPLRKYRRGWITGGIAFLLLVVVMHYLTEPDSTRLTVEVLLFGACVSCSWGWKEAAWTAFLNGAKSDWDKGVLSVWGFWTAMVLQRIFAIVYIGLQRPKWMMESPVSSVITGMFLITAVYTIVAPASGLIPQEWIGTERRQLFSSIIAGLVATTCVAVWLLTRGWSIT